MRNSRTFVLGMLVVPLALCGLGLAFASSVSTPNTFVAGTPALASEVNANFAAHQAAINGNDAVLGNFGTRLGVLAVAHVDGSLATPAVSRFDTRSGSPTSPTVTRSQTGIFLVNFGFALDGRFIFVSAGAAGPSFAGAAYASANPTATFGQVRVEIKTGAGLVDGQFYLSVQ